MNKNFNALASGNFYIEIDPIQDLTFRSSLGGNYNNFYGWGYGRPIYETLENKGVNWSYNENGGFRLGWTLTNTLSYKIAVYPTTTFADKASARTAVRFERRLELGMEGYRFYDLVRWGEDVAAINKYLKFDQVLLPGAFGGASYLAKHAILPIPQGQIDLANKTIVAPEIGLPDCKSVTLATIEQAVCAWINIGIAKKISARILLFVLIIL